MPYRLIFVCIKIGAILVGAMYFLFKDLGSLTVDEDVPAVRVHVPYIPMVETSSLGSDVESAIDALADPLIVCGDPDALALFKTTLRDRARGQERLATVMYSAWAQLCEDSKDCAEVIECTHHTLLDAALPRAPT